MKHHPFKDLLWPILIGLATGVMAYYVQKYFGVNGTLFVIGYNLGMLTLFVWWMYIERRFSKRELDRLNALLKRHGE